MLRFDLKLGGAQFWGMVGFGLLMCIRNEEPADMVCLLVLDVQMSISNAGQYWCELCSDEVGFFFVGRF